jgi:hypothetical protein
MRDSGVVRVIRCSLIRLGLLVLGLYINPVFCIDGTQYIINFFQSIYWGTDLNQRYIFQYPNQFLEERSYQPGASDSFL